MKPRRTTGSSPASKLLVVDACVLKVAREQSAGKTENATSSACHDALKQILSICHRVVLTDDVLEEWGRHKSSFGRKWFKWMSARGKLIELEVRVWKPKGLARLTPNQQDAIMKDAHLVAAACAADRIVITLDERIVELTKRHESGLGLPAPVRWIHPLTEPDAIENL